GCPEGWPAGWLPPSVGPGAGCVIGSPGVGGGPVPCPGGGVPPPGWGGTGTGGSVGRWGKAGVGSGGICGSWVCSEGTGSLTFGGPAGDPAPEPPLPSGWLWPAEVAGWETELGDGVVGGAAVVAPEAAPEVEPGEARCTTL